MESEDDMIWWHGYGNCMPITRAMWYDWTGDDSDLDLVSPVVVACQNDKARLTVYESSPFIKL